MSDICYSCRLNVPFNKNETFAPCKVTLSSLNSYIGNSDTLPGMEGNLTLTKLVSKSPTSTSFRLSMLTVKMHNFAHRCEYFDTWSSFNIFFYDYSCLMWPYQEILHRTVDTFLSTINTTIELHLTGWRHELYFCLSYTIIPLPIPAFKTPSDTFLPQVF